MDGTTLIIGLLIIGMAFLLVRVKSLERRLEQLSWAEEKSDARPDRRGVAYDPVADVPAGVREALDQGEFILAIKRLREATGIGLKEAKEQVEELQRRSRRPGQG